MPMRSWRTPQWRSIPRALRARAAGFSVLEVLVAAAIVLVLLPGIYSVLIWGMSTYSTGEAKADIQQAARLAMENIEADLRMVGYGYPADPALVNPLDKITRISSTSITFWADLNKASTVLAADVGIGSTTFQVASAAGVSVGDTIWLINGGIFNSFTVTGTNTSSNPHTVVVGAASPRAFPRGALVGRPKQITYAFAAGGITRDDGEGGSAQLLVDNVSALSLRYFDATNPTNLEIVGPLTSPHPNLRNIRRITVDFTVQSQKSTGPSGVQNYRLLSDVRPRNL